MSTLLADMTAFVVGDPEADFFEQNPELRYLPVFKDYADKPYGSKICWAVYLTEDVKSKFFRFRAPRRRELVVEHYLNDPHFDWGEHKDLVEQYTALALTREERNYKKLAEKYDQMVHIVFEADANSLEDVRKINTTMFSQLDTINRALQAAEESLKSRYVAKITARGKDKAGWAATKKFHT